MFVNYFNKNFELYGRTVKWIKYESENGNSTDEAQSKGKEGACLDADKIAKEIKVFAVSSGSSPFAECAAERKIVVFDAAAYYPERGSPSITPTSGAGRWSASASPTNLRSTSASA